MTSLATKKDPNAIRKALKTLPEGLHGTYDEVMRRIESQNDDDKQLARRVLFWIFYALRPLTLGELQHALAVEPGELELDEGNIIDGELLASPCAGLVVADRESNIVRLVHYTTQEYLEQNPPDWFSTVQTEIARTCLTYLSFSTFAQGPCTSIESFDDRVEKHAFLHYGTGNLITHLQSLQKLEDSVSELIFNFVISNFLPKAIFKY